MTRTETYLTCDNCEFEYKQPALGSEDVRYFAKKDGWLCDENCDLCPECRETYSNSY